jgi:outer membrane receptor for ferrienterochelin and colicin
MQKVTFIAFLTACSILSPFFGVSARAHQDGQATLYGRVVDARTGEPVARVKVIVIGSQQNTNTDENGGFTLRGLQTGQLDLYITAVGYGFVKRTFLLKEGENTEKDIALNQEAATLTDQITVTADPYAKTETNAASELNLNKLELQTLSMVLVGDPLRAAQALPGVIANNDLRSEFAVRGAGFDRIGVYIDGILTDSFVHRLTESNTNDELSLSVINQDTISELSLMTGAFTSRYGASTAGVLKLETREGNRVRPSGRFATGLLTTSAVVDGPIHNGQGSWLVAGRTSYIDYLQRLVERVTGTGRSETDQDEDANLDFSDMQAKLIYDLSPRHRLGVSAIFGLFRGSQSDANRDVNEIDVNSFDKLDSRNLFINAYWNYSPGSRLLAATKLFLLRTDYENTNINELTLDERERTQFGIRNDVSFLANGSNNIEAGLYVRSIDARKVTNFFPFSQPSVPVALESFDRSGTEQAYYAQDTWNIERARLTLTAGGRVEHSGITGDTVFSPRAALALAPGGWKIRAGLGQYYQLPDFDRLFGFLGNPNLGAERATHYNVSLERSLGSRTRVLAEVYTREDRNLIFSLSEPRVEAGQITIDAEPYRNSLRGYARGIELSLQRRSANGLTGWVSYAYSKTLLTDRENNLSFVSDFDQRHTLNTFASYRFTDTFNLSGQWRYGSGVPWIGFLREEGSLIFLGSERNRLRVPDYSRVDVRASKAFLFKKWKLTLSGEVLNVLHHKNEYNVQSNLIRFRSNRTFSTGLRESFRILPSIGVAIEF